MSETDELKDRIAELEAERDALNEELKTEVRNAKWEADRAQTAIEITTQAITDNEQLRAENAALRKALDEMPHTIACRYWQYTADSVGTSWKHKPCNCPKANVPPLPTQQTLAASSPDGERAGNT